ncbi:MAG: peptide-N-glycosidase F-related protein [Bacteroidota bacterium]|jgi:hypothetical protein
MKKYLLLLLLGHCLVQAKAATGDKYTVITHNNVTVVTNPSTGANEYKAWGLFPSVSTKYRKVSVNMAYKCPPGMICGEWDYIDRLMLRRKGGSSQASQDIELVRYITPYGLGFQPSWSFDWDIDITDFADFFHDSVEIGYIHTGYETNVGRGWQVKLTFTLTEGTPVCEPLGFQKLWSGSYPYGSATYSINDSLAVQNVSTDNNTELLTFRLNHTGHGSDASGCSEFCDKYRILHYNGSPVDTVRRWRKCGDNPLFPQNGTWVYDRGNWCPGALVYPYEKTFPVSAAGNHSFRISMEQHSGDGSAREDISAYVFKQKKPTTMNDIALVEIINPTSKKVFLRDNPSCMNPRIILKNMGKNHIEQVNFRYYLQDQPEFIYHYHCSIPSLTTDTVVLPYTLVPNITDQVFTVFATSVNQQTPGYPYDDTLTSVTNITGNQIMAVNDTSLVLYIKTNNEGQEVGYKVFDDEGNIHYQRDVGSMLNNTVYADTFNLFPGCYRIEVYDLDEYGGDGLGFWANSAGGSGQLMLKRINGILIKNYPKDYGSLTRMNLTVGYVISNPPIDMGIKEPEHLLEANIFPNPASQTCTIDIASSEFENISLEISDMNGKIVYTSAQSFSPGFRCVVPCAHLSRGLYMARIIGEHKTLQRKIVLH